MKKTLILLTAALGMTSLYGAETCTTTYGTDATGTTNTYAFAWTLALNDSFLSSQNSDGESITLSAGDTLSLTQITLGTSLTGMYLAIYEGDKNVSGSWTSATVNNITGTIGAFVGVSSSLSDGTFSFDNVELKAGQTYTFAFVSTNSEETLNSDDDTVRTKAFVQYSKRPTFAMLADNTITSDGYYDRWNSTLTTGKLPVATYTYTITSEDTAAVPEPATATLSLLALAGLAARRRRK